MSKTGHKGWRGRTVSADEAELWKHATRALEPVKTKPRVVVHPDDTARSAVTPVKASTASIAPAGGKPSAARAAPSASTPVKARTPPTPLADFDRRKARQIASGKIEVSARIDLHGLRQHDARAELHAFLLRAYAEGHKTVLVITGKGGGKNAAENLGSLADERQRGVLRRSVPHWLEQPDLRGVVLSYTEASPRHGGAGALYVQLRKSAKSSRGD